MALIDTLYQAGFRGQGLRTAWAVAMRESGGNPAAFNGNTHTGDRSFGLFQINTLGPLQARVQQFGLRSERDLLDPAVNARVAFQMSKGGTDFGAWGLGPNAYKGAPPQAAVRFKELYQQFPGGGQGDPKSRTLAAFASGPAGIIASPSPAQDLQMKQDAAQQMLSVATQAINGNTAQAGGQMLMAMAHMRSQLQAAAMTAASTETQARGYGGTTAPAAGIQFTGNKKLDLALKIAHDQIGKPYVFGAENPNVGFDCSGLIDYAFKKAGIPIPGRMTTQTALRMGVSVRGQQMLPGDWIIANNGEHMVMYVGHGQVIAAPHTGTVVQYQPLSHFTNITDVRRVVPAGRPSA